MELTTHKNYKIKHLLKILIPVLIYQLANYSAQFIDAVMTGRYNEVHLAGVSIGGSLYSPFFTMLTGIISGLVPIVGQYLGQKKKEKITEVMRQYLLIGVFLAFLLFLFGFIFLKPTLRIMNLELSVEMIAFEYLSWLSLGLVPLLLFSVMRSFVDALGLTKLSMLLMILVVPLNVFFNYSLIYGQFGFPEMGGPGAGLGTALAYWGLLVIAYFVFKWHSELKKYPIFKWEGIRLSLWKEPFKIGFPIGLSIFAEVAIFCFVGLLMAGFGTTVIAAHQAAMNFAILIYAFPISISTALTIIVSFEVGQKNILSAIQYSKIGILTSFIIAVVTLVCLAINLTTIASFYGSEEEFIKLTIQFLAYSLLFQLFDAIAAPIQGILRGFKDVQMPFILCLIGYWIIGLPIGFLLHYGFNFGPFSYWIGLILGLMSNCSFLVFRLKRAVIKNKINRGGNDVSYTK